MGECSLQYIVPNFQPRRPFDVLFVDPVVILTLETRLDVPSAKKTIFKRDAGNYAISPFDLCRPFFPFECRLDGLEKYCEHKKVQAVQRPLEGPVHRPSGLVD